MSEVLAAIVAWSMQATALVIATTTVLACARVRAPEVRLRAWQATALVAFAAALPSRGLLVRPQAVEALTIDVVSGPSHAAATLGPGAAGLVLATLGIVASVRLLILVAGWSRLRRSANRGTQPAAPLFDRTAEELGVTARLVVVDGAAPFTFGRRSPIVVVDRAVLADDRTARAVFLHELSHVARGDCTAVVVEAIASCVLWFHPAAWWVARELRAAREEVVDRMAAGLLGSRREYLQTLLAVALRTPEGTSAVPALLHRRYLARRVRALASEVHMSRRHTVCALTLLALCFGFQQFTEGAFWAGTMFVAGGNTGTATGVLNTGGNLPGLLAPLVGYMVDQLGWLTTFASGAIFAIAGAALWLFVRLPEKQGNAVSCTG